MPWEDHSKSGERMRRKAERAERAERGRSHPQFIDAKNMLFFHSKGPELTMKYLNEMKGCHSIVGVLAVLVLVLLTSIPQSVAQADPCKGVDCQKGQCVANPAVFLGYECKCNQGWAKIAPMITFLSCFIPDCHLNFSCNGSAPSPAPAIPAAAPVPSTGPVNLCLLPNMCGNGDCIGIPSPGFLQLPSYACKCHPGNFNMFNQTTGPCLPGCNLQASCPDLGIPIVPGLQPPPGGVAPSPDSDEGFAPSPNPSAVNTSVCANVDCWKGTCAPSINLPWLPQYTCDCENGWLNLLNVSFLACGFPNCTVSDPKCGMLSRHPNVNIPTLQDILNPCALSVCGEGTCVSRNDSGSFGLSSYDCICNKGASNLLNNTSGICVSDGCLPQCLTGGLGWGESQPPSREPSPFDQSPLALPPVDTSSTTIGQRNEVMLGYAVVTLTILILFLVVGW